MEFIIFVITLILFAWIIYRWNMRAYVSLAYKVPSNKWHTFLCWGKILNPKDIMKYASIYFNKYGSNYVGWLGPLPIFVTCDPETIKNVFMSKNCVNKPSVILNGFTNNVGLGLISANEPIWNRHRKVIDKSFSRQNSLSFLPTFQKEVNRIIEEIDSLMEKEGNVDMFYIFRHLTLKNTTKTILKRDLEKTKFNSVLMTNYLNGILYYVFATCVSIFLRINCLRKLAEMFIYKHAKEGLDTFKNLIDESWDISQKNDTTDISYMPEMISTLDYIATGVRENMMNVDEMQGEMMQLFFAAFESTASTLTFVILMLAMHPEYQQRVYEEVVSILPDNDDEEITLNHVDQLTYLEMVLNETMRILPVIPMVVREICNEPLTLSNGLSLPVGQIVSIDIFNLHRSKEIWGAEADIFNPDNFLPANISSRHSFSFIPFTKGKRYCIGSRYAILFSKVSLAKIIKTYKFTTDANYHNFKFQTNITLKFMEQPQLYLERREICKVTK